VEDSVIYVNEKKAQDSSAPSVVNESSERDNDLDPVRLNKAFKFAAWSSIALVRTSTFLYPETSAELWSFVQTLILMILIPLPLFGASTVYSVAGFMVWVVIGIIWTFCSAFAVVLYPLWESRAALAMITRGIVKVIVISHAIVLLYIQLLNDGLHSQDIFAQGTGKYVAPGPAVAKPEAAA